MIPKRFIVAFFLALSISFCFAQTVQPVKWEFSYNPIDETKGEVILKANIGIDWHIYSQLQSGDGPLPTIFRFEPTPDYDLVEKVVEPTPVTEFSSVFSTDVMSFSNEVVFKQKIKRTNKGAFIIMGHVECMACNSSSCLPPKEYKFNIQVPSAN